MINQSIVQKRGKVDFPDFRGTMEYMVPIHNGRVPDQLCEWQRTVDQMLLGIHPQLSYLMIDQRVVQEGTTQRRPGLHMDGYWHASPGRHAPSPPAHGGNNLQAHGGNVPRPQHQGIPRHHGGAGQWQNCDFSAPEATLLACDILGGTALSGEWQGKPAHGGDCSHIDIGDMGHWHLTPGFCWAGNVAMLHKGMPAIKEVRRTLVRLTVPGWSPEQSR